MRFWRVALGDTLSVGPYLAQSASCPAVSPSGYVCNAPPDHFRGDIPHVAYAEDVVAIWDDRGYEVSRDRHPVGTSLLDDPIEREWRHDTHDLHHRFTRQEEIRQAAVQDLIEVPETP